MSAKTAVDAALKGGGLQTGEAPQPDFFSAGASPCADPVTRGRGRPKGSVNRTTAEFIAFIQRQYGDPRVALAKVMATPLDSLRRELGSDREFAADFWRQCVLGLLPYIAGKPAVEVAVKSESTRLVLYAGSPQQPAQLPQGGIVALLEGAAAQARAEGWDAPETVAIEGDVVDTQSEGKSDA